MTEDSILSPGTPEDAAYESETRRLLERPYLQATDPRGQSGFRGDSLRWKRARGPIIRAVDRDGTFLDVGCANGLLMESITRWAGEEGFRIEPYGLELIDSLAVLARRRLPHLSHRIFTGNAMLWRPPFRFDFVRTELEYAPHHRRGEMVGKMLSQYLPPTGSENGTRRGDPAFLGLRSFGAGRGRRQKRCGHYPHRLDRR